MSFNYRQRMTAMGHVVAFLATMALCYVSFMGLVYLLGGHLVKSAILAVAYGIVLFTLAVLLQRLKGCRRHFSRNIEKERITAVLLAMACVFTALPFTHFFTVYSHEREVSATFTEALQEVQEMFVDYEATSEMRIKDYQSRLEKAVRNKKKNSRQYARMGLTKHTEGKVSGGDTLMTDNMVQALRLQLLSPAYMQLRREAQQWLHRAAAGATTRNAFLMGNAREIRTAVGSWQQMMNEAKAVRFYNEATTTPSDTTATVTAHAEAISQRLDQVLTTCSRRAFPTPHSLLLLSICWLALYFPYWLQNRDSKSWERFFPAWMRWHRNVPSAQDVSHVNAVRMSDPRAAAVTTPWMKSASDTFRQRMEKGKGTRDAFVYIAEQLHAGILTKEALIVMLRDDHNLFDADTIEMCLDRGVLTKDELTRDCGIDPQFLSMLGHVPEDVLPREGSITQLPQNTTQFFFWGIPSSGKTCAAGVILRAIQERKVVPHVTIDEHCQGYEYQEILSRIFSGDGHYCILPGRTLVDTNFAIQMTLEDWDHRDHPITLIDMAGELFCSILWQKSGDFNKITEKHLKAQGEFEKIFMAEGADHQKFHVFVIEYGAEDKKHKGFNQDTYMEYGLQYLDQTHVLRDATEGVYVLITKTDQARRNLREGEDLNIHLARYMKTYYPNFLGLLDKYCRDYELCGGKAPDPIPFDIGEVCFNNYCKVSTSRANDMVKIMLARSKGFRKGWLGKVEQWFNH